MTWFVFRFPRSGVFLLFKICDWSLENTQESALNFWLRAAFWASCSYYLVVMKALSGWHGAGTHAVALAYVRDTSDTLPEVLLFCSNPQLCRGELPGKKFLFSACLEVKPDCFLLLLASLLLLTVSLGELTAITKMRSFSTGSFTCTYFFCSD